MDNLDVSRYSVEFFLSPEDIALLNSITLRHGGRFTVARYAPKDLHAKDLQSELVTYENKQSPFGGLAAKIEVMVFDAKNLKWVSMFSAPFKMTKQTISNRESIAENLQNVLRTVAQEHEAARKQAGREFGKTLAFEIASKSQIPVEGEEISTRLLDLKSQRKLPYKHESRLLTEWKGDAIAKSNATYFPPKGTLLAHTNSAESAIGGHLDTLQSSIKEYIEKQDINEISRVLMDKGKIHLTDQDRFHLKSLAQDDLLNGETLALAVFRGDHQAYSKWIESLLLVQTALREKRIEEIEPIFAEGKLVKGVLGVWGLWGEIEEELKEETMREKVEPFVTQVFKEELEAIIPFADRTKRLCDEGRMSRRSLEAVSDELVHMSEAKVNSVAKAIEVVACVTRLREEIIQREALRTQELDYALTRAR